MKQGRLTGMFFTLDCHLHNYETICMDRTSKC